MSFDNVISRLKAMKQRDAEHSANLTDLECDATEAGRVVLYLTRRLDNLENSLKKHVSLLNEDSKKLIDLEMENESLKVENIECNKKLREEMEKHKTEVKGLEETNAAVVISLNGIPVVSKAKAAKTRLAKHAKAVAASYS